MPEKRHKPEEIVAKLRRVDVLVSKGQSVAGAIGVTEASCYRWRQEFGDLKTDQAKRLKDLEKENQRLRKTVSTCRSFATISSGECFFCAIAASSRAKSLLHRGLLFRGSQCHRRSHPPP